MTDVSRRHFLCAASGLAIGLAAGCGGKGTVHVDPAPAPGPFTDREVRIFVGAGHENALRETFVPAVEKHSGAKVTLLAGEDGVQKLKEAKGKDVPFDLLLTDATHGRPAAREGLFARPDRAKVPNLDRLAGAALDDWVFREGHGVPFPDSALTLAYHKQQAGTSPRRWDDLLRRTLGGKVGLDRAFPISLYTFACVKAALNNKPNTALSSLEKDLDGVLTFAHNNRGVVNLWWTSSAQMLLALTDGKCAIGNVQSTEAFAALRENRQLGAVVPDEDRAFRQAIWCIAAGSANKDVAQKAIDVFFSDEVQLGLARRGWPTALPVVAEKMAKEDALWKQLYPHSAEQFRSLRYLPYDLYDRRREQIADAWERTVLKDG